MACVEPPHLEYLWVTGATGNWTEELTFFNFTRDGNRLINNICWFLSQEGVSTWETIPGVAYEGYIIKIKTKLSIIANAYLEYKRIEIHSLSKIIVIVHRKGRKEIKRVRSWRGWEVKFLNFPSSHFPVFFSAISAFSAVS